MDQICIRNAVNKKARSLEGTSFFINGGEGGMYSAHPAPRPTGCLRQFKFVPDNFLNRRVNSAILIHYKVKNPTDWLSIGLFTLWRRGWDLNPRRAINPCRFSRPVHSAALPPLLKLVAVSCAEQDANINRWVFG